MVKKCLYLLLVTVFAFSSSGCASIVGKDVFPLAINSNPDGANIIVKDDKGKRVFSGTTPTTITLTAGESYFHAKSYNITFSKPGYAEQYVEVKATLSGWYWGNILFGGLIGMLIVDPITGKMWKLPEDVTVNLSEKLSLNQDQPTLKIITLNQVPENIRKSLIEIN